MGLRSSTDLRWLSERSAAAPLPFSCSLGGPPAEFGRGLAHYDLSTGPFSAGVAQQWAAWFRLPITTARAGRGGAGVWQRTTEASRITPIHPMQQVRSIGRRAGRAEDAKVPCRKRPTTHDLPTVTRYGAQGAQVAQVRVSPHAAHRERRRPAPRQSDLSLIGWRGVSRI